jgi:hypothetical protein
MIPVSPQLTSTLNTAISYRCLLVAAHSAAASIPRVTATFMGVDDVIASGPGSSWSGITSACFLQEYLYQLIAPPTKIERKHGAAVCNQ